MMTKIAMIPNYEEAFALLKKVNLPEHIINHSVRVAELAAEMGEYVERHGIFVDMEILIIGALLHDIGRSQTHAIDHGAIGARILRDEDIDERIARIAERHVGAGLEMSDGFDYDLFPETIEEKIVAWADKLTGKNRRLTPEEALKELEDDLGENHPGYQRLVALKNEMEELLSD